MTKPLAFALLILTLTACGSGPDTPCSQVAACLAVCDANYRAGVVPGAAVPQPIADEYVTCKDWKVKPDDASSFPPDLTKH